MRTPAEIRIPQYGVVTRLFTSNDVTYSDLNVQSSTVRTDLLNGVVYFTVVDADGTVVISKTSANINEIEIRNQTITTTRGQFVVKFTRDDTAALTPGAKYYCDAWVYHTDGTQEPVLDYGRFHVDRSATDIEGLPATLPSYPQYMLTDGSREMTGTLKLTELATYEADQVGIGQIYAKDDQTLWFRTGTGVDVQLGLAGGGGGTQTLDEVYDQGGNTVITDSGPIFLQYDNITSSFPVANLVLWNTTPATALVPQQWSPILYLSGRAWDGSASQANSWSIGVEPIDGAGTTSVDLLFQAGPDGAATSTLFRMKSGGQITGPDGSRAAPTYSFDGLPASGMWRQGSTVRFGHDDAELMRLSNEAVTLYGRLLLAPAASTSGAIDLYTIVPAHTNQPASTEIPSVWLNLSAQKTWNAGAIATQRAIRIQHPTYAFTGSSTITTAATMAISGAPNAGVNATITDAYSLWVESGNVKVEDYLIADRYYFNSIGSGDYLYVSASILRTVVGGSVLMQTYAGGTRFSLDGSAGTPAIQMLGSTSDFDTGFFKGGEDILAVTTGGVEAVRWDASQNTILAENLYLAQTKRIYLDGVGGNDYLYNATGNSLYLFLNGSQISSWLTNGINHGVAVSVHVPSIGEAETIGFRSRNVTSATAVTQQWAPMLEFEGRGWETDVGSSQAVLMAVQLETVVGAANPSGLLQFKSNINGAGYVDGPAISSNGDLIVQQSSKLKLNGASGDTGVWSQAGTDVAIRISGTNYFVATSSNGGYFRSVAAGSASQPRFVLGNTDDGIGRGADNDSVNVITGAIEAVRWNASQQTLVPDGLVSAPSYSFATDTTSGLWMNGSLLSVAWQGATYIDMSSNQVRIHPQTLAPQTTHFTDLGLDARRWEHFYTGHGDFAPAVNTSGATVDITYTAPAHTGLTTATEVPMVLFDMSATKTWADGTVASQSAFKIVAPTLNNTTSGSFTNADTVYISGPPIAGGATSIGTAAALRIGSGPILIPDGSLGAPTLALASDPDTGVWGASAILAFQAASTYVMEMQPTFARHRVALHSNIQGTAAAAAYGLSGAGVGTGLYWPTTTSIAVTTAGTEAVSWDATQDQYNAGSINLNIGQQLFFDADSGAKNTYIYAAADNDIRIFAAGSAAARIFNDEFTSYYTLIQQRSTSTEVAGSSTAEGLIIRAAASASAGIPVRNSPTLEFQGNAWDTVPGQSEFQKFAMQMRVTSDSPDTSGMMYFSSAQDSGAYADIGTLSLDGDLTLGNDTDRTTILGRARLDSRTTDNAFFSHVDHATSTTYALRQENSGKTHINSAASAILALSVDGTARFNMHTAYFRSANGNGPSLMNEVASGTNPTLVPNQLDETTGIGANASGQVSLITGGTEALRIDGSQNVLMVGSLELDGALNHDGTTVGFYGTTPVAQSAAYTPTNVTTDRTYDANSTTLDEVADVLGTLIADLQATGLIG